MADKYDEIRENVSALLAKAGVTYSAEFVPQSKSRNALEKEPSLNWRVTLTGGAYRVVCATCGAGGSVPHMSLGQATKAATRDSGKPCNACGAS